MQAARVLALWLRGRGVEPWSCTGHAREAGCGQGRRLRGAAQAGTVVMDTTFPSAYEQIMDKAKGLSVRTFALANAVVGNAVVGAPRA